MSGIRSVVRRARVRHGAVAAVVVVLAVVLTGCGPVGAPDTSFGSNGFATFDAGKTGSWEAVFVQSDNKLLVAGEVDSGGTTYPSGALFLARYNDNGTPDTAFGTNGVTVVAPTNGVNHVSSVIVAGARIVVSYATHNGFAEWEGFSSAGALQVTSTQFPVGGLGVQIVKALPGANGAFSIAGTYQDASTHTFVQIERFTSSGTLDPTFGIGGVVRFPFVRDATDSHVVDAVGRPDGGMYVAGTASLTAGPVGYLAAIGATGAADYTFGQYGIQPVVASSAPADPAAIALWPDGHIAVGSSGSNGNKITRYNTDGTTDQDWAPAGDTVTLTAPNLLGMNDVTVDAASRVLVTTFQVNGPTIQPYVTRITLAGTPDTGFGNNGAYLGNSGDGFGTVVTDPSNRVLLGGARSSATQLLLARLNG
jgi:uncharacterized delta-60 repeat protein